MGNVLNRSSWPNEFAQWLQKNKKNNHLNNNTINVILASKSSNMKQPNTRQPFPPDLDFPAQPRHALCHLIVYSL